MSVRQLCVAGFLLLFAGSAVAQSAPGTWKFLRNSPDGGGIRLRHDDMVFLNPSSGWVVNLRGEVWKTDDGGETWSLVHDSGGVYGFRSIGFANQSVGWAGAVNNPGNVLFETRDGGDSWTEISSRISGSTPAGICGIQVIDASVIYAVGAFHGVPHFVRSLNGGSSWTSIDLSNRIGSIVDLHFFNRNTGILVGGSGSNLDGDAVVLKTFDGGTTWNAVHRTRRTSETAGEWGWKISFPTATDGFVSIEYNAQSVGQPAKILTTNNGGNTWTERLIRGSTDVAGLQGIGFVTPQIGYASGRGTSSRTTDGGLTWTQLTHYSMMSPDGQLDGAVNRIRVLNDTLAYAVGRRVYKYVLDSVPTSTEPADNPPPAFTLEQNYPNPFAPSTTIGYTLHRRTNVRLQVFDFVGRKIRTLVNEYQHAGRYEVTWDGRDEAGARVASGAYMYLLDVGEAPEMKQMILIR